MVYDGIHSIRLFCAFVAVVLVSHNFILAEKKSGPYSVNVVAIGQCEESGTNEFIMHTRVSRKSREGFCYSGWMDMPYGFDDNIQERWDVYLEGSTGGWKRLLTFRLLRACTDTKRIFPGWFNVMKASNRSDGSCPVPIGNYTFGCMDLSDLQFESMKEMIYGNYKVVTKYYINKSKFIGCAWYLATVNPRVNYSSIISSDD